MSSTNVLSKSKRQAREETAMSIDTREAYCQPHPMDLHHGLRHRHPSSPYGNHVGHPHSYARYAEIQTRPLSHQLQPVVTSSFSTEEREGTPGDARVRAHYGPEQRYDREERHNDEERREDWTPPRFERQPKEGPTPSALRAPHPHHVERAFSSPAYFPRRNSLKRNYYHHSQAMDEFGRQLPSDFVPPKRLKLNSPSQQETIVSPRHPSIEEANHREWYSRSGTWDTEEGYYKFVGRSQSYPVPPPWSGHFSHSPASPMGFGRINKFPTISPSRSDLEGSPRHWHPSPTRWSGRSPSSAWTPPRAGSLERSWSVPYHETVYPRRDSPAERLPSDANRQGAPEKYQTKNSSAGESKMDLMVEAAAAASTKEESKSKNFDLTRYDEQENVRTMSLPTGESILLLALPQDRVALSETLCVVRENIEVFTATQRDVDAPAPGRKHAVVVGQVGLRCIHCRHTMRCSDRVKRAVCYPSSIKRIYRTVIDMKLDHFSQCKFVPSSLRNHLDELKAVHTRSTGTTMQYFIRAAHTLGMEDGPSGVRLTQENKNLANKSVIPVPSSQLIPAERESEIPTTVIRTNSISSEADSSQRSEATPMSTDSFDSSGVPGPEAPTQSPENFYSGLVPLALPEDKASLSPLRCFLREQVCAFSATEEDIAVRAPTTFSISVGQVGIGCIHCVKQPAKLRSNRAVCFPFSIGRIYQSVADIQRFHLGECKMMSPDIKTKFLELQSASSKGSKGLATRQYWVTSARKIGLIDTPQGLRFGRDPTKPDSPKAFSLDILAQVAFSVTTASKQLVLPEDKPCIAEFLYVVMEQLQPCRFTEADRNKRRLKDVGCIGVECKHCAGQVDGRKFFWSSVSAVESNFVSVHTHMLECRMVPESLKQRLIDLKKLRKEQTAALRTGSQKAFFARVWERLHNDEYGGAEDKTEDDTQSEEEQSTEMVSV